MLRVLTAELKKVQGLLLLGLVFAGPVMASLLGETRGRTGPGIGEWESAYMGAVIRFGWLFYPLLAGVFAALVCRSEHVAGGWKQLLSLPVPRSHVFLAKYVLVAALLLLTNLVFVALFVGQGLLEHLQGPIPWGTLGRSIAGGWLAVLPLAALQLSVSTRWRSFGAALALNVCLTLPAIFAAQSEQVGPWYPWAQPVLAMMPKVGEAGERLLNVEPMTLWVVIVGGFIVVMTAGLATFVRSDVRG